MMQIFKYKKIRFTLMQCTSLDYYVVPHQGVFLIFMKNYDSKTLHKLLKALVWTSAFLTSKICQKNSVKLCFLMYLL